MKRWLTSKDWAYHSLTFSILGILFSPSGRASSSAIRCESLIGSSSDKNWDALSKVPWEGFWPNRTICWSDTVCQSPPDACHRESRTYLQSVGMLRNGLYDPIMRLWSWTATWSDDSFSFMSVCFGRSVPCDVRSLDWIAWSIFSINWLLLFADPCGERASSVWDNKC
jgi:hypothetical protein